MKIRIIFVLLQLILVSSELLASDAEYKGDCKFIGSYYGFVDCLDNELAGYDKELNELYNKIYSSDEKVKKIERLWIRFKENDCDFMAREVYEGKDYQPVYKICLINKTKARIADLNRSFFVKDWYTSSIE